MDSPRRQRFLSLPKALGRLPEHLGAKVKLDSSAQALWIYEPLTSNDLAALRALASDDRAWQQAIDQLVKDGSIAPTGLFPATLWGTFLERLQAGEERAWTAFVRRYQAAITACLRGLLTPGDPRDADEIAAEFIAWLYLPSIGPADSAPPPVAQHLKGLKLVDPETGRVHRFRGWLRETLKRWLQARDRKEGRLQQLRKRIAEDAGPVHGQVVDFDRKVDEAVLFQAADEVLHGLLQDSRMHYRALMDLLRSETLEVTVAWLRSEDLPSSIASASRVRARATRLFRERLVATYCEQYGGDAADILDHIGALAARLSFTATK